MPVRTPALCRQSVSVSASVSGPASQPAHAQSALASHTGIWITDSMLRRDLERYHHRRIFFPTPSPCRGLGSHAGPLESRRRLGKRNMAGLMPSTPVYPPLWHFHVASIPSAWQWEPPTTRDERIQRAKSLGVSLPGLFNRFIRWLEKSDADRPFIEPPPLDDIGLAQSDVVGEATLLAPGSAVNGPDTAPRAYPYAPDFPREIMDLRSRIMLLGEISNDALRRTCRTCRRSLQRRIERRQLSAEGLKLALEPFDQVVLSRIGDPLVAAKFAAPIRRTILSAMIDVQREDPGAPLEHLWLAYADWICESGGGHSNTPLFWTLLQCIPEVLQDQIPSRLLLELTLLFLRDQANQHNIFAHWVNRTRNFSQVYGTMGASQREKLQTDVSDLLESEASPIISDTNRKRRIAWLVVQAYDNATTDEALVRSHESLIRSKGLRLNDVQIWQLMVGRAQVHAGVSHDALTQLMGHEKSSTSQRWAALIKAVLTSSPHGHAALQTMCNCLRELGEMDAPAMALLSPPTSYIRVDCVKALAAASNDHRFALRLYHALEGCPADERLMRLHFTREFWTPYVKAMIEDAELDPTQIFRLLDFKRASHIHNRGDAESRAREVAAKADLLDKMGHWYMQTRHLGDRQLLRRISHCASLQRQLIDSVSPRTLANLALVIVKDLDAGRWGRTTRLEWLVRLVAGVQGQKEAKRVASVLRGWRSVIDERRA